MRGMITSSHVTDDKIGTPDSPAFKAEFIKTLAPIGLKSDL